MAIELYWDNDEQTIMLCEFDKHWTWSEMFKTLDDIKKVTDKRDYEIGAIIDVTRGVSIPGGSIFSVEVRDKAQQMMAMGAESKGPIVIAGAAGLLKMFASAFTMLDKRVLRDVYFADSMKEARQIMVRRLAAGHEISA